MKLLTLATGALLAGAAFGLPAATSAQQMQDGMRHDAPMQHDGMQNGTMDHHDGMQNGTMDHHDGMMHDGGMDHRDAMMHHDHMMMHHGWHRHCWTTWRHHHRVRVCR